MTRDEYKNLTNDEKKEAKAELWQLIKEAVKLDTEAVQALKVLRPSLYNEGRTGGAGKPAKYIVFGDMFEQIGDTVSEIDLFKSMYVGRKEGKSLIKDCIRKATVDERKWISFDPETGDYELISIGANAPDDWVGYEPVEEIDDDLM